MIMATIAAHILRNPTGILISLICFSPLVHSEDYNRRQERLLFRSQSTFQCESEGYHPDAYDCSIFYRCIDWGEGSENSLQSRFTTFRFQCKEGAIYDIDTSGCIHPSESSRIECKNQQQHEPLLINIPRAEALQSAASNRDYGVVEPQPNDVPTSQPPYGNKPSSQGSQIQPESDPDNSIANEQPPRVTRSPPCSAEGFFAIENDCSHFYRCVSSGKGFLKYEFSCGEGTVWDPENNACNHAWAVQRNDCKSNTDINGNHDENNNVDGNDNPSPEQISQGFSSSETPNINSGYPASQQSSSPANPPYSQEGFNNGYQNQPTNGYQPNRPPNNSYPSYNGYPPSNGNSPGQQFSSTPYPAYGSGNSNNGYQPNGFSNNGYPSHNGNPSNQQLSSTTNSPYGQGNSNNINQPNNNLPNNQNPPSNNYPSNQQPSSSGNPPNGPEDYGSGPSNSASNNDNSPINSSSGTSCTSEGFHPVENNCKKFIRCVSNGNGFTKYEFDCAEGTVWDNNSVTCNYPYAVQDPKCRLSISSNPSNSNQDANQQTPSPSSGENTSSAFTPQNSPISSAQSQGQTTPYGNQQTSSYNEQTSSSNQQTSSSTSQTSSTSSSFNQQTSSSSSSSSSSSTSSGQQTTSANNNNNQQGSSTGSNQQTTNNQQTSTAGSNQQNSSSSSQQSTTSGSNQQSTSSQQQSTTSSGNQQTTGGNSNTAGSGQQTTSSGQQGSISTTNQQSSSNQQGSTTGSSQQTTSNNNQQTTSSGQQTSTTGSSQQTTSGSSQQTNAGNNSGTTSSTDQQNMNSSITNGNSNTNSGGQTTNNTNKDVCSSEGFFPSSISCNKFYRCVSNGGSGYTKYEFNCGPGTVWDPDQNTCNHPWAVQNEKCRSSSNQIPASGSESSNKTNPNSSPSTESLSTTVTSSSTPSALPSSGLSSPTPISSSPVPISSSPAQISSSPASISSSPAPISSSGSSTNRPPYGGQYTPTSSPSIESSTPISSGSNQSPSTPVTTSPSSTLKPSENQTNLSNAAGKPTSTINPNGSENPSTLGGSTSLDNATSTTPINEVSTNSPTTTPGSTTGNGTKPLTKVNCTKAGFYPHPTDCKKFYRCVDWDGDKGKRFSVYHFDCPAGTIFDPSLDTCNHEESVYPPRQCDSSAQVTEPPTTNCTQPGTTPDTSTNGTQPTESPGTTGNLTETTTSPGENISTTPNESGTTDTAEQITTSPTNGSITTQSSTPGVTDATTEGSTGETTTPPSGTSSEAPTYSTPGGTSSSEAPTYSTPGGTSSSEAPTYPTNAGVTNPPTSITTTSKPEESSTLNPTTVEPTTTTSTSPSEKCPQLGPDQFALVCPTGFRRHPKYCNVFYQCTVSQTNEIKVLTLSCTNGTVYDDRKIQCLPPSQAQKCDGSMMDTRNLRKLSDNSVSPIAVKSDKSICPGEGSFSFKDDCRLFYKCQKSNEGKLNGYVYQCPEGYGYWNVSKRCEKIEKVPCEGGQKTKPISKPTLAPVETKNIGNK